MFVNGRLINETLTGTTILGQSGPESYANEGVLHGASPSNGLASYLGHSLVKSYSPAEMQLMCSTAAKRIEKWRVRGENKKKTLWWNEGAWQVFIGICTLSLFFFIHIYYKCISTVKKDNIWRILQWILIILRT